MFYPDLMVDIETSGVDSGRNAILQLAAVPFNLERRVICADRMFERCLAVPAWRTWSESTRAWWMTQNQQVLQDIMARAQDPMEVMREFAEWAQHLPSGGKIRFWSRGSFDFMFVQSYIDDAARPNPFPFWEATDMRAWLRGLYFPNPVPRLDVPRQGPAHHALFDAIHQISDLFAHADNAAQESGRTHVLEPEILGAG